MPTHVQDVTLRLISERLLPKSKGEVYISGELIHDHVSLPPPREDYKHHVYISPHNPGAAKFVAEISAWLSQANSEDGDGARQESIGSVAQKHQRGSSSKSMNARIGRMHVSGTNASHPARGSCTKLQKTASSSLKNDGGEGSLRVTQNIEQIGQCESMLCYLTGLTWTQGAASNAFSREVAIAFAKGVPLLLVHEMPGEGQSARHGVAFGTFFAWNATPAPLIKAGIYATIAVAMKSGPWREPSKVMMAKALAAPPKRNAPVTIKLSFGDESEGIEPVVHEVASPPKLSPGQPPALLRRLTRRPSQLHGASPPAPAYLGKGGSLHGQLVQQSLAACIVEDDKTDASSGLSSSGLTNDDELSMRSHSAAEAASSVGTRDMDAEGFEYERGAKLYSPLKQRSRAKNLVSETERAEQAASGVEPTKGTPPSTRRSSSCAAHVKV